MKKIIVLTSILFMAACSSTSTDVAKATDTNEKATKVAASSNGVVCKIESIIGSNRKREVCTSAKQRDERREAGQEALFRRQGGQQTAGGDGF